MKKLVIFISQLVVAAMIGFVGMLFVFSQTEVTKSSAADIANRSIVVNSVITCSSDNVDMYEYMYEQFMKSESAGTAAFAIVSGMMKTRAAANYDVYTGKSFCRFDFNNYAIIADVDLYKDIVFGKKPTAFSLTAADGADVLFMAIPGTTKVVHRVAQK